MLTEERYLLALIDNGESCRIEFHIQKNKDIQMVAVALYALLADHDELREALSRFSSVMATDEKFRKAFQEWQVHMPDFNNILKQK